MLRRRQLLVAAGATLTAPTLAGCTGSGSDRPQVDGDVIVGPNDELSFEPETLTISTGEEVTWGFASTGHNVSCNPRHSDNVDLPEDAEPFASYEGNDKYLTEEVGTTFSHTFTTPGTYTYVCIPHVTKGMIGEIRVEA